MLRTFNPKRQADRAAAVIVRRIAEKAARRAALVATQGRAASMGPACTTAAPKAETLEHEGYRRLVALLPCKACGIASYSQAAHPNTGKGMAMKTDDRLCFPLCCARPDIEGCHILFDTGRLLDKAARRAVEPAWGADTRRQIVALGLWPENLPMLETP
ncbi:MAG: hypothetical protein I8H71_01245 [Xanthomonadaceae bacterium]|nr:hypothetical protein [Xanthomonadaceae bacterium]